MKALLATVLLSVTALSYAAPLGDFQFKSPAFNGAGYSSHVLTIENQEATRRKANEDKVQAAIDKAAADAKNTNLSKFLNNLESRIYAQISQNVATAMFANNSCSVTGASQTNCSGSIDFQNNKITWARVNDAFNCTGSSTGQCILLRVGAPGESVDAPCGNTGAASCIYVPLSSFNMPGN